MTLVELLVAIAAGLVVTAALYAILTTTLFQTTRVFSRVDATQRSRLVMENIASLLHSSCLANDLPPIWSDPLVAPNVQSSATTLAFVSRYGGKANLTPVLHKIALSGTTLLDTTYANTGQNGSGDWTFSSTPTATTTMLTNVSAVLGGPPLFQYFAYTPANDAGGQPYHDEGGNPFLMLLDGATSLPTGAYTSTGAAVAAGTVPANSPLRLAVPLSTVDAGNASEVLITMNVSPSRVSGLNTNLAQETTSNAIVLRLTPVLSDGSDNQVVGPCA